MFGGLGVSGKRSRIFGLLTRDIVGMVGNACALDCGDVILTVFVCMANGLICRKTCPVG